MNKAILKAATRDKATESALKKQFKEMLAEGEKVYPLGETGLLSK